MKCKVLLVLFLILFISSTVVVATSEDLGSLNDAIKSQSNIGSIFSGDSQNILMGLSKSFFDIVRYAAFVYIIIRLFMLAMEFEAAGNAPETKASIKIKAMWHVVGLLFAMNFWTIAKFLMRIADNFNFI